MKTKKIIALLLTFAMTLSIVGVMPTMVSASTYSREQYYADSIAEYSQHDLSDPQHITDADFFGVWDREAEEWTDEPMFDYFRFPEMSDVENAAKLGDYETCKEELLKYYRAKHETYAINGEPGTATVSEQSRAQYEMCIDNFIRLDYTLIAGKVNFNRDYSWDSADVKSVLDGIRAGGSTNKNLKFLLACGKKADIIAVDLDELHNIPKYDLSYAALYSVTASDVTMTMCDGKILYENGEFTTIDIEKLKYDMRNTCGNYFKKA